jgi:hypothetical protein
MKSVELNAHYGFNYCGYILRDIQTHDNTVIRRGLVDTVLQGVGKLRINSGCKGFTTSVLLQPSCTVMSYVSLRGGDLLTQNCTNVTVVKSWV